ncbi:MAG TPA: nucleoid-associated protein, partial [Flavobacterium sp.]|nr:nucleoid-associated protein [Flavobacterium sp.]
DVSSFSISNTAVSDMRKKIKSLIRLDTGVEIKVNITNPETFNQVVEKGWDEEKQQYYYLVYFNQEIK